MSSFSSCIRLTIGDFCDDWTCDLYGDDKWNEIEQRPMISFNKGATFLSYRIPLFFICFILGRHRLWLPSLLLILWSYFKRKLIRFDRNCVHRNCIRSRPYYIIRYTHLGSHLLGCCPVRPLNPCRYIYDDMIKDGKVLSVNWNQILINYYLTPLVGTGQFNLKKGRTGSLRSQFNLWSRFKVIPIVRLPSCSFRVNQYT